ncbi:hypothetical protein NKR23_g2734 [Pleurostoma richardsiae]|uniref:Uncharacterized protein n=1 Tax=Pleurostoma richardsiae TaxID=41990 RepID=A0AA38S9C0_9PEZI|nr:hypothetical protein NKR23_g2734 [Pleurostoma richardsiae]
MTSKPFSSRRDRDDASAASSDARTDYDSGIDIHRRRPRSDEFDRAVLPPLPKYKLRDPHRDQLERERLTGVAEPRYQPKSTFGTPLYFQTKFIRDLVGLEPTRLNFTAPHDVEPKDSWFELVLLDLYERVEGFAEHYFETDVDYPADNQGSPWLEDLPQQFIDYVSLISRGDPLVGGWDDLIRDSLKRRCVVSGVFAKVLEMTVFNQLLFGATDTQKKLLHYHDMELVENEGYTRAFQRAEIVRSMFPGPDELPPNFWSEVDKLALQTTRLFIPLVNSIGKVFRNHMWGQTKSIYQDIHNIVAEAAFITNVMRRSASIFRIEFPRPGAAPDMDQEDWDWDGDFYEVSKKAAEDKQKAETEATTPVTAPAGTSRGQDANAGAPPEVKDLILPREYTARVQIALWPSFKRHTAIGEKKDGGSHGATHGESISRIAKAQCIYYQGLIKEMASSPERTPLQDYIADQRREVWRRKLRKARSASRKVRWFILHVILPLAAERPGLAAYVADLGAYGNGYTGGH